MHVLVRAALRGGFVGVGFALSFIALILAIDRRLPPLDELVIVFSSLAFTGALVVGAASCVELVAARREPTRERDLVASFASLLLAAPLVLLAAFECAYTFAILKNRSGIEPGLEAVKEVWRGIMQDEKLRAILLACCPPLGAITFARLRGFHAVLEVAFVCGITVGVWTFFGTMTRAPGETYVLYAVLGLVLSLGTRAGDALARKIEQRLSRDAEGGTTEHTEHTKGLR
jgi:hypothetical protein